ncbi:MAG TPA: hypothetical protein VE223_06810 [Nitrososphaeraceae archaeon]|nr:hypothetical protein [Nitrososphaeraceae archaeon]
MIDEGTEKRWLFDTLRYNLQNFSDGLQLEDKDFESSIDKYVSFLLQIRNNLLALVGFVATIAVSLGTISLLNNQQLLWILTPDFVVGIAVYLIINIILIRIQKVLSPIREAYDVTENITQLLKGFLGSVPFFLEVETTNQLKLMNIYVSLVMNSRFMLASSYSLASKSKFLILHRTSLSNSAAQNNRAIQSAYDKIYKTKRQELITDPLITNVEKEIIRNFDLSPLKGFETLWTNEHNAMVT